MDNEKMVMKGKYWVYETGWYKDRRKIIKEEKLINHYKLRVDYLNININIWIMMQKVNIMIN